MIEKIKITRMRRVVCMYMRKIEFKCQSCVQEMRFDNYTMGRKFVGVT